MADIVKLSMSKPFLDQNLTPSERSRSWLGAVTRATNDLCDRVAVNEAAITALEVRVTNIDIALAAALYQTEVTADYTTTGSYDQEIVICNNTSAITITLQLLIAEKRVTVIRAGTGAVTIDGDGATITGVSTQTLPLQYDAADMTASSVEWLLK